MPEPFTRRELDQALCSVPGCKHKHDDLTLHGRCHKEDGCEVEYKRDGVIYVRCYTCKRTILNIRVADGPPMAQGGSA